MKMNFILTTTLSLMFVSSPQFIAYADDTSAIELSKKTAPFNINYILEGVEVPLKNPKMVTPTIYNNEEPSLKLSNNLPLADIDIQYSIRDFYFSHYEVDGRRIESIDAIIASTNKQNTDINVVYSEEKQSDGYLRKGFRDGVGLDIYHLKNSLLQDKKVYTDILGSTLSIEFSNEFTSEVIDIVDSLPNENDKTLYLSAKTALLPNKESVTLTNKYGYVDGFIFKTSLKFTDIESSFQMNYIPTVKDIFKSNEEVKLYGINLEGKIELLSNSTYTDDKVSFQVNFNPNKYQFLFISTDARKSVGDTNGSTTDKPNNKTEITPNPPVLTPNGENITESVLLMIILSSISVGALLTYFTAAIITKRKENLKKQAHDK